MAKKLNRNKPFGMVINAEVAGAVFDQEGCYYDSDDLYVSAVPGAKTPPSTLSKAEESAEVAVSKSAEVKAETLARATSILGDLGSSPATEDHQEAQKENAIAQNAEDNAE